MARIAATNYNALITFLNGRWERIIGNNTVAQKNDYNQSVSVHLHGHRIVTLFEDGKVNFSMCGYGTVTTRERINHFLLPIGFRVHQHKGDQVLHNMNTGQNLLINTYVEYSIINGEVFDTGSISGVEKSPIKVL